MGEDAGLKTGRRRKVEVGQARDAQMRNSATRPHTISQLHATFGEAGRAFVFGRRGLATRDKADPTTEIKFRI